ncbi:MAG: hypothetical protein QGG48_05765, partial [Desulfatiglandales bacterium]|nr:hypothetical protein [Desulfatiglandales bacterium]
TSTFITLSFIALIRLFQNWKLLNLTPWSLSLTKPIIAGILTFGAGYFPGMRLSGALERKNMISFLYTIGEIEKRD